MTTVLIVDDRPENRDYLATLLSYRHYRVVEAGDGLEGLEVARRECPDLIISDILMPTMDGYDFVRALRADPSLAATPVIFSTAHYLRPEALALAKQCGVGAFLFKPCEPALVLSTVEQALGIITPPKVEVEAFDREHSRLLADELLEKADALRTVNEKLSTVIELGLRLDQERDPAKLFGKFCAGVRAAVAAKYAIVGVLGLSTTELLHFSVSGVNPALAASLSRLPTRWGQIEEVLSKRSIIRLDGLDGDPASVGLPRDFPPIHNLLVAPIASPSVVYGWICLINKIGLDRFSDGDENVVVNLGAQAGRIYENVKLYRELQDRAEALEKEVAVRAAAERAAHESEQRFRVVFDTAVDGMILIDSRGTISMFNPAAERLFGYRADVVIGQNLKMLMPSPYQEEHDRYLETYNRTRKPKIIGIGREVMGLRKDGTTFPMELSVGEAQREGRSFFVGIVHDITARRKTEGQLRQSQRMEAIGQLTGGVAHDFNNLLTIVMANLDLLEATIEDRAEGKAMITAALGAASRGAELTHQLLAFSRRQTLEPNVIEINNLVEGMVRLLSRTLGENVEIDLQLGADLWPVLADPTQLESALTNLAVNARDAMPDGGKLIIETKDVSLDEAYAAQNPEVVAGDYVALVVSDTGIGMPPEVAARAFEPFFTTKAPGKGTGLGLSMVFGFVKQSGGHIKVYSEIGQGTTIRLYLPRADAEATTIGAPKAAETIASAKAGEVVLLVEDDGGVRNVVAKHLSRFGYRVLEAPNGPAALALLDRNLGINLLFTDLVMPGGMNGVDLAEQARAKRPEIKLLFTSGYSEPALLSKLTKIKGATLLGKPYKVADLARKIRQVIDGGQKL
ncbi:MAG: response regulator [Proteobacteria bacterium]|nr:response regulator [Pseudomonadota bacterium]MBI3498542.1 response regulator [Pseudomonadota bacterium]